MSFQNINSQQDTNQMMKLTSIFSILFISVFFMTFILAEDKGVVNVKLIPTAQVPTSESLSTMVSEVKLKDLSIQSHESLDEPKITKQAGTGSYYQTISMHGN